MKQRQNAAFSVLELVIVIAVILVIASLSLGPANSSRAAKSRQACSERLALLSHSLQLYAADHEGQLPSIAQAQTSDIPLALLVPQYTADTALFLCPGRRLPTLPQAKGFQGRRIGYAYYMGVRGNSATTPVVSDAQINADHPKAMGSLLFSETGSHPGGNHSKFGGNILFADGHVLSSEHPQAPVNLDTAGVTLLNPIP